MKALKAIALLGLAATAAGPVLTFAGTIPLDTNKIVMIVGMILWFVGATPWLGTTKLQPTDTQVEI